MNAYYWLAILFTSLALFFGYLGSQVESQKGNNDLVNRLSNTKSEEQGVIKGKLILEDNGNPISSQIKFYLNGQIVREIHPKINGEFLTTLKKGQYSLHISSQGYDSKEIDNIIALEGTGNLGDINLSVSNKTIKIKITDKSGMPYSNIELALMKGLPPAHSTFYTANNDGEMIIDGIGYGIYNFFIGQKAVSNSGFLWVLDRNNYVPSFELKASKNKYNLILPKVLYSDLAKLNPHTYGLKANFHYVAQSVKISTPLSFSGIGIGVGLNGEGTPSLLEIRKDNDGKPGDAVIFSGKPYEYGATISTRTPDTPSESSTISSTGSYADSNESKILEEGIFWIVAKYDNIPEKINILGGKEIPLSGIPLRSSSDGRNWEILNLPNNLKMLDTFIVE